MSRRLEELQLESRVSLLAEGLLVQGMSAFILLRLSTDWMRSTLFMVGNLLFSETTALKVQFSSVTQSCLTLCDLNVNCIQKKKKKIFTETSRIMLDQISVQVDI